MNTPLQHILPSPGGEHVKNEMNTYYRAVKAACPPPLRRRLLRDLREHVATMQEEDPACDIVARLGTPEEFAAAWAELYCTDEKLVKCERRKWVIALVSIVLAIFLVIGGTQVALHYIYEYQESHARHVYL